MTDAPLAVLRSRLEDVLRQAAARDAAFRSRLLADPHGAIEALFGADPVSSIKIRVLEEAKGEVILVLPRPMTGDELPDELLDYAAGGKYYGPHGTVLTNLCNFSQED